MRRIDSGASDGVMGNEPGLRDLLRPHDAEFVRMAYQCVLGRPPEAGELGQWLLPLRDGSLSKMDVLLAIRYSPEGRGRAAGIPGLPIRRATAALLRLPLIGRALRWMRHLAGLSALARRVNALESNFAGYATEQAQQLEHSIERAATAIESGRTRLAELETRIGNDALSMNHRVGDLAAKLAIAGEVQARLDADLRRVDDAKLDRTTEDAVTAQLAGELRKLDAGKADREAVEQTRSQLASVTVAAVALEDALRHWGLLQHSAKDAADPFDDYYLRFEERFRGSSEQIRERLRFYLPILHAVAAASPQGTPFQLVDLGCGRGEMLEVMQHDGLQCYGVDTSDAMLEKARERGVAVERADAIEHLRTLEANSLSGLTSIHVIEHLPFRVLVGLLDEAFRVLRPGGVAMFETPNPENLIVGACNFYFDPTHLRPLPPEPMRFMLESIGFERVTIERLHPGTTPEEVEAITDGIAKLYSTLMLVPQDYALIAYKPAGFPAAVGRAPK